MQLIRVSVGAITSLVILIAGCGGDDPSRRAQPIRPTAETLAPSCASIAGAADARGLFAQAVVAPEAVRETIVFGSIDPGYLEPINFEQGFKFDATNIEITAPADLYVTAIEYTEYTSGWRQGEIDYGLSFDVCSRTVDGIVRPAVAGGLAHVTALSESVETLFDGVELHCQDNANDEETATTCSAFLDLDAAPVVIAAGTTIGSGGGTGTTPYQPGLDFNLIDFRFENVFANPNRLGAEEGPGLGFRYGACLYEYFTEPTRTAYLDKIGQNGTFRASDDQPCGTLSVDVPGTAAGIWIREDKAALDYNTDWVGVLSNLLVLIDHPFEPAARQVVSTEMRDIAEWFGGGIAVELSRETTGDVNVAFDAMTPGPIYCLRGAPFGSDTNSFFYYVQLDSGGERLRIEPIDIDCNAVSLADRTFSSSAIAFVR